MNPHTLSQITNYFPITDRIATGGQPTAGQFAFVKEAGYQIVINLALSTSINAIPNEGELVTQQGMTYIHIPVLWEQPELDDFVRFQRVMDAFEDKKIFVHCALNMRVSCFIFLFRVLNRKMDAKVAWNDLEKIWEPNEVWQKYINDLLDKFHPKT